MTDSSETQRRRIGRPPAADGAMTRRRIIATAEKHFALYGYERATVRDIAKELDLTPSAVYHYYPTKVALYEDVARAIWTEVIDAFQDAIADKQRLTDQVGAVFDVLERLAREDTYRNSFASAAALEARFHPELDYVVRQYGDAMRGMFTGLVRKAKASGELGPDVAERPIIFMLLAATAGLASFATVSPHHAYVAAIGSFKRAFAGSLFGTGSQATVEG
jgi:AcrR family transcriptional regulator